ncbi:MAG: Do family serine endopeptidase [Deltaproteobacteria bacterium]|nr:Do family serine endopeptidase [Deltaproteobacteria bacterium]MBW1929327.1 Do family serine endopeptidase [Deltaproteobacteria bacterium]MBW2025141.1 Do family serine endopeptidase [Deltaproteobacteria bacterium]MBW2126240.1 Do family serine endopeptidase [Deltaproteobacteria bacterium]
MGISGSQRHSRLQLVGLFIIVLIGASFLFCNPHAIAKESVIDLSTAISQVAKKNIPAVVHIDVIQRREVVNPFFPFENDPFFRFFFGGPQMPRKFKQELRGLGTGMIMDEKGYILTNNHVVAGATEIKVLLANGKRYPAKLIGTDPKTDLAVIKISAKDPLPHVVFGDSDKVEVGQWVVAIGHPRGLDQTVTQGIISAKHRRGIMDPSSYQDYLQTDAAINPGNSGGPLLNLKGEVIGVNAAIATQSGGFEGIGFAIPSNMALHIAKELIAHGKVQRGWLGVSVQDLTPELAEAFHVKQNKGALIADVVKGGPADKAGLKRGDIVVSYDGKPVPDASSLRNLTALTPVGKVVNVEVIRKAKHKRLSVKVGNLDDALKMKLSSLKERLGVEVRPATQKDVERYGLQSKQGVVIIWVDPDGPLGKAGFEVNDMILEINGRSINDVDDLADMLNTLKPGRPATILALDHRTGRTGYIRVMIG